MSGAERPLGVPEGATFVPGGASFADLRELHENRADKRSYLRVTFPFVLWQPTGLLRNVMYRALSVNRRSGGGMGRCYVWSDESRPVPGVWVWTLAEERAEQVAA